MDTRQKTFVLSMTIIGSMFAILGFSIGINAFFIPFVKDAFNITTTMSYLVMTATFSAYVVFGPPSGAILNKIGYKDGMVVAFILIAIGFFLIAPAARIASFALFLLALFVNGMGQTLLTGAVNTYVSILGPEESAASRISLMGICHKVFYAGASLILAIFMDLVNVQIEDAIVPFYIMSGILVVIGVLYYFSPLPEVKAKGEDESDDEELMSSSYGNTKTGVLQFPHLLLGVLAIFFDVGLEQIALGTINDYATILHLPSPGQYVWMSAGGMVIGYLLGIAFIPNVLKQRTVLILSALLGVATTIIIVTVSASISIYFVAVLGLANAMLWPAIWPLAIAELGKFTKQGSSLLVMGLIGGAIIPLVFGYVADVASHQVAYWVCIPSYVYILYYAIWGSKIRIQTISDTNLASK